MDEIGGAVERIDDPDVFVFVVVFIVQIGRGAGFFSQDCVAWICAQQDFDDGLFGGAVDFGHEIVMLFFFDFEQVEIERAAIDDGSAAARGFDRRIKHWMHDFIPNGSVKMAAAMSGTRYYAGQADV